MRSPVSHFFAVCAALGLGTLATPQAFAQFGPSPSCSASQIGGVVFRDFNQNGLRDAQEPGQIAVRATAYDKDNVAVGTALSDIDGAYRIDLLSGATALRVEFTELPATLFTGPGGTNSVTTVAFSAPGACSLNLGIATPAQYCEENPKIAVPTYTNGDPLDTTAYQYLSGSGKALSEFPYNSTGSIAGGGTTPDILALNSQVGPTWGLAYQRSTKSLFASAFMKRHTGFGVGGTGAIYKVDRSDLNNPVASLFVDLQALGIDTGADPHSGLTGNARNANYDDASFAQVGKISLGDMDISRDEKTLYVMNLKNKTLYSIFIDNPARVPTAADVTAYPVPNPGCSNGDYAAFAVKVHDAIYVGVNCTAETSQLRADLKAFILRLDGNTFNEAFQMNLDYTKGFGIHPFFAPIPDPGYNWKPWARNLDDMFPSFPQFSFLIYPMPLVSNIEFDNDGSIVFNIMDLLGHRVGPFNSIGSQYPDSLVNGPSAGDILRLCQVGSNVWSLENNAACPNVSSVGANNNQGPGGGEFYFEDRWVINHGGPVDVHQETATGAAVIRPGSTENKSIYYDLYEVEDGGVKTMSNVDGSQTAAYQVYTSDMIGTFGKAAGLGDLELICEQAPVQIGNRVWRDLNGNGRQDADEPGIAGVTVNLYDSTGVNLIATKVTGSDGSYLFGAGDNLVPNTSYRIRLDNAADYSTGGPLADLVLTAANASSDQIDSDASLDVFATISVTTGAPGENNHTYDIGFGQLRCEQFDLKAINGKVDGNAKSLSKIVKSALKERAKLAKKFGSKKCKPLTSKKQKELVKLANAQYLEVWTLAWSYGVSTNICESLLTVCATSDISDTINIMISGTANLKTAVDNALAGGTCKATSSTKKKLAKQAQTLAAESQQALTQLQSLNPLVSCQ